MQRVEFCDTNGHLYCPFCGHCVIGINEEFGQESFLGPCIHTLYVAHDEGFEYRSEKFNELAKMPDDGDEFDFQDVSIEELTDSIELRDSVKFALYVPAPSFYGTYLGFWVPGD